MSSEYSLGELEVIVLLATWGLGPERAYGALIHDEVEKAKRKAVSIAAVYNILGRLEDRDFLVAEMGEPTPERGGRRKRFYRLTGQGQVALDTAQRPWIYFGNLALNRAGGEL